MRQTGVGLSEEFLVIATVVIPIVNRGLSNTTADINSGTLAERVDITSGTADVGNVDILHIAYIIVVLDLGIDVVTPAVRVPAMTGT